MHATKRFLVHFGVMIESNCPLCGGSSATKFFKVHGPDHYLDLIGKDYESLARFWIRCDECTHRHNSVRLSIDELRVLYDRFRDQEWRQETPDQYFDRITSLPTSQSENSRKVDLILSLLRELEAGGQGRRMIDIGCGGGVLIDAFKRRLVNDWSFFGVEPTNSFAELAARRTGANVVNDNYRSGLFGLAKFDLATCCQVLEHLEKPREFLSQIRLDLREGAWLYLEVPDESDFETLPADHDRFMAQHISYFGTDRLQRMLEAQGFVIGHSGVLKTVRGRNNLWFLAAAA